MDPRWTVQLCLVVLCRGALVVLNSLVLGALWVCASSCTPGVPNISVVLSLHATKFSVNLDSQERVL